MRRRAATWRARLTATVLASAAVVLLARPSAASRFMDLYERGQDAVQGGRHAEGRDLLLQAMGERSEEGQFRIGMRTHQYYPSRWLAEAYLGLGDLDEAERRLRAAEGVRRLPRSEQDALAGLRRRLDEARSRATRPPPTAAPAGPSARATAARAALDSGDLAAARSMARQALSDDARDATAREVLEAVDELLASRIARARRALADGTLGEAEEALAEVLRIDGEHASARLLIGEVRTARDGAAETMRRAEAALQSGRSDEARTLAERARSRDTSLAARAREVVRRASARPAAPAPERRPAAPPDATASLRDAETALESGDLAAARRAAAEAESRDPTVARLARSVLEEVDSRARRAATALARAGEQRAAGRFDEALRHADEAAGLDRARASEAGELRGQIEASRERLASLAADMESALTDGAGQQAVSTLAALTREFPAHPELGRWRAAAEASAPALAGLAAYFRGDLTGCVSLLSGPAEASDASADVLAVLAAAHASQALLADEAERDEALSRARELFARAREGRSGLRLDPRFFSPRVIRALDDGS